jgi:hypothetical protein
MLRNDEDSKIGRLEGKSERFETSSGSASARFGEGTSPTMNGLPIFRFVSHFQNPTAKTELHRDNFTVRTLQTQTRNPD